MLAPLLSLALAVLPASPAGAASRADIARMATEWTSYRNSANRMMTAVQNTAPNDGWNRVETINFVAKVRVMIAQTEDIFASTADIAREEIRASEPPSAARLERENAVAAIHEAQAFALYANFVPRILDEGFQDRRGRNIGRDYCGPEWTIAVTIDEVNDYLRWWQAKAGFTDAQYDAFHERARANLGLPPAGR